MGKYALTPERIIQRINSFNKEFPNSKVNILLDSNKIVLLGTDGPYQPPLMYCKPQYIENLLTALHIIKQCRFYCTFYCKGVKTTDYYNSLALNNKAYKRFEIWKNGKNVNWL